jgi:protein phosphatase
MCSDGLSNMVDNVEIQRIIEKPVAAEQTVKALVAAANDNGGMDNIAVIIIEPDSDEEEQC